LSSLGENRDRLALLQEPHMPVPWAQIVRLMPSILEVSHELLKRTRRQVASDPPPVQDDNASAIAALQSRIQGLEENERRQAELVTNMADQLEQLTTAVTALHRQWRILVAGQVAVGIVAVVALVVALHLGVPGARP
jgi:hypothetical protein